jgi:hypothetical protein
LPRKAVHNWVEKFSQGRSKLEDARPGAEVAWDNSQKTGFPRTGKSDGTSCISVVGQYIEK